MTWNTGTGQHFIASNPPLGNTVILVPAPTGVAATDQANIAAAITAVVAAGGGTILLQVGTYLVNATLTIAGAALSITVLGAGVDATVVKVANSTFTKNGLLFNFSGTTATFQFDNLTIDLNGPNQSWGTSGSNDFYKAISADLNNTGTERCRIIVPRLRIKNASMNTTIPQGIGINTFGFSYWDIGLLLGEANDITLHITQAFSNSPYRGNFDRIACHNPSGPSVVDEGTAAALGVGSWHGRSLTVYLDAICGAGVPADGLVLGKGATSKEIQMDELHVVNGRYILNAGLSTISDAQFGKIMGSGCRGSVNIQSLDGSCSIDEITVDGCAVGGASGVTVFASLETGGIAAEPVTTGKYVCNNSQNSAIQGFGGPVNILSGRIKNGTTAVAINTPAGSSIRGVTGYNPVGVVSPAVPLTGVAVAAQPYDRSFWISTGAGATTIAIQSGPTITLAASTAGQYVRVPAGLTMTPTFTNAPTWVVEGE